MSSTQSLLNSTLVMFMGILFSIVALSVIGPAADDTMRILEIGGYFEVSETWQTDHSVFLNMMYFACFAPALLGVAIHFIASVRRSRYAAEDDVQPAQPQFAPELSMEEY